MFIPVGGIRIHMHFMLSVHYTALRGDVFAFVRRYLRPRPQISPSSLADISARARRYLCPWPFMTRLMPPTGILPIKASLKACANFAQPDSEIPRKENRTGLRYSAQMMLHETASPARFSILKALAERLGRRKTPERSFYLQPFLRVHIFALQLNSS